MKKNEQLDNRIEDFFKHLNNLKHLKSLDDFSTDLFVFDKKKQTPEDKLAYVLKGYIRYNYWYIKLPDGYNERNFKARIRARNRIMNDESWIIAEVDRQMEKDNY